nr:hypothetical protein [Rickettsia endosymbiont of Ceutorhynchus assimilis]
MILGYFSADFLVKELAIYDGKQVNSWIFKPKILYRDLTYAQEKEVNYVFHNLHGISYNAGYVSYNQLNQLLMDNLKGIETVYVKGHIKKDFLIKVYTEMNVDPPIIVNLEYLGGVVPKLNPSFTYCKNHRINFCSCSVKNVYALYNYVTSLLPQ